jgi:HEAT repeat protein
MSAHLVGCCQYTLRVRTKTNVRLWASVCLLEGVSRVGYKTQMKPLLLLLCLLFACTGKNTTPKTAINLEELRRSFWDDCRTILKSGDGSGAFLVAEAIDDLGDEAGVSILHTLASHEEYIVRARAAQAFLRFPKANPEPFRPLLTDDIAEVRLWGAAVFTMRGDTAAQKTLEDFLQNPEPLLDSTAAAGEDPTGRHFRKGYLTMTAALALTFAKVDKTAILRGLVQHDYAQVRYPSALALAMMGQKEQVAVLQEGLQKGFLSPRASAVLYELSPVPDSLESALSLYAVGKQHEQKALSAVAAYALSKAKVQEVQGFLEENANDASPELRFLVRWALLTPKVNAPAPKLDASHFVAPPDSMPDSMSGSMPHSMPGMDH